MVMYMSNDRPSKKQRELLGYIDGFIRQHGYGPSYREIMRGIGYKSVSTVAIHVDNLIAKGFLTKRTRSARSLEVTGKVSTASASGGNQPATQESQHHEWLVRTVQKEIAQVRKYPARASVDNLYVLVGALHLLGLAEAAEQAKAELATIELLD
jgi:SOS-response transcriptional repressor LexA